MNLINARGHIIVEVEGRNYIIDTGSPISFNYAGLTKITLDDREFAFSPIIACEKHVADELTGLDISGFIGMNIIKKTNLSVNFEKGEVIFGLQDVNATVTNPEFYLMPFEVDANLCIITDKILFASKHLNKTVIDTGASISYVSRKHLSEENRTQEKYFDAHPSLGNIHGNFYEGELSFSSMCALLYRYIIKVGVMPEQLDALQMFDAVIGIDLLSEKYVAIDFQRKYICIKLDDRSIVKKQNNNKQS